MSHQRSRSLPAVDRPHWTVAIILAVDDQVACPLASEAKSKDYGEQVEDPRVVGPEQYQYRERLNGEAHRHHSSGAISLSQDWSHKPADHANHGNDADNDPGRRQRREHSTFKGQGNYVNQDHTVPGATQTVNQWQVPEGLGAPRVLVEHLLPQPFYRFVSQHCGRIGVPGPVGLYP